MKRIVHLESLDVLPPEHVLAQGSRRDLRRINLLMGHRRILIRAITTQFQPDPGRTFRLLEIGCGDGSLMMALGKTLHRAWPKVQLWLLDQAPVVDALTVQRLGQYGWEIYLVNSEVNHWLSSAEYPRFDLVLINLFLHHFRENPLRTLLRSLKANSNGIIACEPRRSLVSLCGSLSLGLIGCNRVTRQDGLLSVKAGFQGQELSQLWTNDNSWQIEERSAGLFSHLFSAQRQSS